MKKKLRRQLKKSTRAVRKALKRVGKRAGGAAGITTGVFALGGLAAAAALNPAVQERARALLGSARDLLNGLSDQANESEHARLEHTH